MDFINAAGVHNRNTGYSQSVAISKPEKLVFVSGQIPVGPAGGVPESFEEQARLTWSNIEAQLQAADMELGNIVKHTTFLSDRRYHPQNTKVRREVLGDHEPALTVIVTGIFDEGWLLEIEAIAAR